MNSKQNNKVSPEPHGDGPTHRATSGFQASVERVPWGACLGKPALAQGLEVSLSLGPCRPPPTLEDWLFLRRVLPGPAPFIPSSFWLSPRLSYTPSVPGHQNCMVQTRLHISLSPNLPLPVLPMPGKVSSKPLDKSVGLGLTSFTSTSSKRQIPSTPPSK